MAVSAVSLLHGQRNPLYLYSATGEQKSHPFLLQRLAVAVKRSNAASFSGTVASVRGTVASVRESQTDASVSGTDASVSGTDASVSGTCASSFLFHTCMCVYVCVCVFHVVYGVLG